MISSKMNNKSAIIVGAGLGGLTAALRLSKKGYKVTIIEKNNTAGGRLNIISKDGFRFDVGPTFFSMSYIFHEFMNDINEEIPFEFIELDPLYTVNFRSNKFVIYKDLKKLAKEFESTEPNLDVKLGKYLEKAGQVFVDTEPIIRNNYPSLFSYVKQMVKVPLKHLPMAYQSMWKELTKHFDSYEAKVIFSLVAFFLGNSPYQTPALYCLLNYTEMVNDGYYNVKGGMYKIVEGILALLSKNNVEIVYNTEIVDVVTKGNVLNAVIDVNGKEWIADTFIVNADAAVFRGKFLHRSKFTKEKLNKMNWTIAPFTIYLGVKGKISGLEQHNYFLGNNFTDYAENLLSNKISLEKPYYYVNVSSKHNPDCAPDNCEAIFILCPVPDLRFKEDWNDRETLADTIISDLQERCNFNIKENIISKTILDPKDWEKMFGLYMGSGLGLGHNLAQVAYLRPKNKDEKLKNLYYVGASTIPGTGLPMVVLSSKLVVERIINET